MQTIIAGQSQKQTFYSQCDCCGAKYSINSSDIDRIDNERVSERFSSSIEFEDDLGMFDFLDYDYDINKPKIPFADKIYHITCDTEHCNSTVVFDTRSESEKEIDLKAQIELTEYEKNHKPNKFTFFKKVDITNLTFVVILTIIFVLAIINY